jgi:hypothetical protein
MTGYGKLESVLVRERSGRAMGEKTFCISEYSQRNIHTIAAVRQAVLPIYFLVMADFYFSVRCGAVVLFLTPTPQHELF